MAEWSIENCLCGGLDLSLGWGMTNVAEFPIDNCLCGWVVSVIDCQQSFDNSLSSWSSVVLKVVLWTRF